jgi:hypothetical protein
MFRRPYGLFLLAALGVASAAARADEASDVRSFVAFFGEVTNVLVADKDSCSKMASDLNAVFDANRRVLEAAKKAREEGKKLPAEAQKRIIEDTARWGPALQKCSTDQGVQAALTRMQMR